MGRSRMMGAGNACHSMYTNTNKPTGGGNKKQGLVSYVGLSDHANRARLIGANGSASGRQTLTVQNQLSGVTSSEFRRASSYARADGVHRGVVPVPAPIALTGKERIIALTDRFFASVAKKNPTTPEVTASLFCSYGILLATVSVETRTGDDILKYFQFFNNLPNLAATYTYSISQIPDSDVWVNNVAATFTYDPSATVNARMQFTYDGDCIYELYSAKLPELNEALFESSGKY